MNSKSSPEFFEKNACPFHFCESHKGLNTSAPGVENNRRRGHKTNLININSKNIN